MTMLKKNLKRILCTALALTGIVACTGTLTACETAHPEVEMKIEFNGKTYTLEYELYRKIAPATVEHFITLAEKGYYNGLCVHDYTASKLYTGAYTYENDALVYKKYYEIVEKYNLPDSVWVDKNKSESTDTLYGEFYANGGFTVENGALKQSFGSLTMYYTPKSVDNEVYIERHNGKGMTTRSYKYNSATSQFFISLAETEVTDNNYCTFATLDSKSKDDLKSLMSAIDKYIADNYTEEDDSETFAPETEIEVDEDDRFVGDKNNEATYHVPQKPIVIKKVSVNKY